MFVFVSLISLSMLFSRSTHVVAPLLFLFLSCIPETMKTPYLNYTSIFKKKKLLIKQEDKEIPRSAQSKMLDPRLQALKTKIAKVFLSLQLPLQLDGVPPLKAVSLPDTVCSQEDQSPSCITQRTKSGPAFLIFLLTSCSSAAPPSTDSGFLISCTVLF